METSRRMLRLGFCAHRTRRGLKTQLTCTCKVTASLEEEGELTPGYIGHMSAVGSVLRETMATPPEAAGTKNWEQRALWLCYH
eukprot:4540933-Amphidinium_carterae.1